MIVNKVNFLIFTTVVINVIGLFYIKNQVRSINYQLNEVTKQIEDEKDKIHLLKAEIAHITSPQKIKKSIENNLVLEKIKLSQLGHDPLHENNMPTAKVVQYPSKDLLIPVKWRFKKNPIRNSSQPVLISKKH